jgi:hypothetical protein
MVMRVSVPARWQNVSCGNPGPKACFPISLSGLSIRYKTEKRNLLTAEQEIEMGENQKSKKQSLVWMIIDAGLLPEKTEANAVCIVELLRPIIGLEGFSQSIKCYIEQVWSVLRWKGTYRLQHAAVGSCATSFGRSFLWSSRISH